jgi:hypothetical protein
VRSCLIVLHPRNIARAVESIDALPVDKVWFRAFTEPQLVEPLNRFIRETDYDAYAVVADDVIASRRAWDLVAEMLESSPGATGYCRLAQESPWVNVVRAPLRMPNGHFPVLDDYDFYHRDEVQRFPDPLFVTWFGGWALTALRRELWLEFPFRVNASSGGQSDFETFFRLGQPILCHRDTEIEHLKERVAGVHSENVLVGREAPSIRFDKGRS